MPPARTLRDAFNAVDPARPLEAGDPRYVDCNDVRGHEDVVSTLFNAITYSDRPLHQMCTGHRGSGKSTELLRLKARLEQAGYEVIYFEADDDLDLNDLIYSDLLLTVARRIEAGARERDVALDQELRSIERWFAEVVYSQDEWRNVERELQTEASLGIGLPESIPLIARLFAKLTGQIKTGQAVKHEVRRRLDQQVAQLIAGVNELLQRFEAEARKKGRQGAVVIVEALCTGCSKCLGACDIGAIGLVRQGGRGKNGKAVAVKCNQCNGQTWCVRVCEPGALEYAAGTPELNGQTVFERLRAARVGAEAVLAERGAQPRRRVKVQ